MSNILEIKQQQLGNKIGQIVPWDYKAKPGEKCSVFTVYINGEIPVRIKSELNYEQFCKIC